MRQFVPHVWIAFYKIIQKELSGEWQRRSFICLLQNIENMSGGGRLYYNWLVDYLWEVNDRRMRLKEVAERVKEFRSGLLVWNWSNRYAVRQVSCEKESNNLTLFICG